MKAAHYFFKIQATLGIAVIALAAGLFHCPSIQAARGGGSGGGGGIGGGIGIGVGEAVGGLVINLVANYIYDAAGNKVKVNPPMNGQITAKPKVEAFGGYRKYETINGYAHSGLTPDIDAEREGGHNDDKWTAYFNVDFNEVVDNPDYDPDAYPGEPNSNKYELRLDAEFNDHGDQFKSRGTMKREYSTAKKGYFFDDDGNRYRDFSKKGRWVYYGTSERIKCSHRLVNEVDVGDNRLAKNQKYEAEVWWKLDHLTWSKDEEDFVWKWTGDWQVDEHTLSATSSGWKKIVLLEQNTEITELEEKGSSRIWWKGRAVKPWLATNYIVWEPEQHDELNGN